MNPRPNPWGTIFLVAAALGFGFFSFQPWWSGPALGFVRAFFEAALVGAVADWFAVTALFKRPLGLPLPHTDILVRRKDQLVQALPQFLASFLEPPRLDPVLKSVDWAGVLLDQMEPTALDGLFDEALNVLWEAPGRPAWEQRALELGTGVLYRELVKHKDSLGGPVTALVKKNAGWKGLFVSRETVDEAVAGFLDELQAVRDQPNHPLRRYLLTAFHESWPRLAQDLRPSRWTAGTWTRLAADPAFRQQFNAKAGEAAVVLWRKSNATAAITGALTYLLAQTDAKTLASRIEASVGNDLQYIRVNGALVGGLVGLVLEALKSFLTPT